MKRPQFHVPQWGSFGADGFIFALRNERHLKKYIGLMIVYLLACWLLNFPLWLYSAGIIYFLFLIIFELFNSALEILCDFVTDGHTIAIKRIKDLAAGAVFVHGFFGGLLLAFHCLYYVVWR
jgi:diacylglycerol kinase